MAFSQEVHPYTISFGIEAFAKAQPYVTIRLPQWGKEKNQRCRNLMSGILQFFVGQISNSGWWHIPAPIQKPSRL
jgi:hypothetical protein